MKRKKVHVVPHPSGWAVQCEGASRASSVHSTKTEAVDAGRAAAKSAASGQLAIHGRNGQVQTEHTYGSDPYPPRG